MNNITIHGGEEGIECMMDSNNSKKSSTESTNKNKKSLFKHFEINSLDKIIENDNGKSEKLKNDIHSHELNFGFRKNKTKKVKFSQNLTPVTVVDIRGGKKGRSITQKGMRVLLDSGSSHSVATTACAKDYKHKWKPKKREFNTAAGVMGTKYESKMRFSLREFSESKIIKWKFSLVDKSEDIGYDMIIGRDLMKELGLVIDFNKLAVVWEGTSIPMRDYHKLGKLNKMELNAVIQRSHEPIATQEATERMVKILEL